MKEEKEGLGQNKIKSVSWVLVRSYLLTMGISLLCAVCLFQVILQREINYKFQRGDQEGLNTVAYLLSKQIQENERVSATLATDTIFQNALTNEEGINVNKVSQLLRDCLVSRNSIRSIHMVAKEGNIISEFKEPSYIKEDQAFLKQFNLQEIEQAKGSVCWGIGKNILEPKIGNTLYLTRLIQSKTNLKPLGYLIIYFDPEVIKRECEDILNNINMQVMMRDASGNVFSMQEPFLLDEIVSTLEWQDKAYRYIKKGRNKYYYITQEMPIIKGMIVGVNKEARTNSNSTILVFGVIVNIIFLSCASLVIKRKVVLPLKHIAEKARTIGKQGKLDTKFRIDTGYTEVYDITYALDEMMEKIKQLVSEVEEREKLQKRLELSIINHQVKPHFLYNTLNAASILVAIEEKEAANELIKTLAKYYRACLDTGEDIITLADELQIVKEYVKIATIRNPNIIDISYDVEPETLEHKIPKMTIQTLVENSIKYGIKKLGKPVKVHIDIKFDETKERVNVIVEDDGGQIDGEMIEKIMSGQKLEVKSGFGLKAIITRMMLYYDIKDISEVIKITSECGKCTKILLKLHCYK